MKFTLAGWLFHICVVSLITTLWCVNAVAHEVRPPIATVELHKEGKVALTISLNLEATIAGIGAEHDDSSENAAVKQYNRLGAMSPLALSAEFDRFALEFLDQINLVADDGSVPLRIRSVEIPDVEDRDLPRFSEVALEGIVPSNTETLYWRLDAAFGNSVIRLRDTDSKQILTAKLLLAGETSGPLLVSTRQYQSWERVFARFLVVGFTHIVPKGLDHILFVVGLFLLSTKLNALIWQITAFTIAHTTALAVAMVGIVRLDPAIVEPLIAASIVYVAIENIITDRSHTWRLVLVFCFGLLHGLGFAGVLSEIGPAPSQFFASLLAFNLGVELGQLAVIATCFLGVGWTMNRAWYRFAVVIPASLLMGLIATIWVAERLGG